MLALSALCFYVLCTHFLFTQSNKHLASLMYQTSFLKITNSLLIATPAGQSSYSQVLSWCGQNCHPFPLENLPQWASRRPLSSLLTSLSPPSEFPLPVPPPALQSLTRNLLLGPLMFTSCTHSPGNFIWSKAFKFNDEDF